MIFCYSIAARMSCPFSSSIHVHGFVKCVMYDYSNKLSDTIYMSCAKDLLNLCDEWNSKPFI